MQIESFGEHGAIDRMADRMMVALVYVVALHWFSLAQTIIDMLKG